MCLSGGLRIYYIYKEITRLLTYLLTYLVGLGTESLERVNRGPNRLVRRSYRETLVGVSSDSLTGNGKHWYLVKFLAHPSDPGVG